MKVLFDLVHPANVLVFYHTIASLKSAGAEVRVGSRHKDVLVPLLDEFGIEHTPISRAGQGLVGLGSELIERDYRLWRIARAFRPDVMVGYGGVAISHVGKLLGIPSLSFYDTEFASLQIRLAVPFISEWHVPESWRGLEAKGRTFRFPGGKQFAYLHPDHFKPSADIAKASGWDPACDNFVVRIVNWQANHDQGRNGLPADRLREVVGFLRARGKVHISAEGELPDELEPFRYRGNPGKFHHLLAQCRLCFGESITVASEAVMLGVPALLQIDKSCGYGIEQREAGLIEQLEADSDVTDVFRRALSQDVDLYRARARAFVATKGDMNLYVLRQIERVLEGAKAQTCAAA